MASKLSTLINALTGKTTPVDADKIPVLDSENSFNHNWLSFTQLKVYLATLYAPTAKGVTNGDSHDHSGGDGAQIAYSGLSGLPTLGTAAATAATDYATAAQGATADTAVQPGDDAADLGSGSATDGYVLTADGVGGSAWEAAAVTYAGAASEIHAATEKTTPVDADELGLVDSAAGWVLKKLTWANLKTTLSGVFALLAGKSGGQTLVGGTGVTDRLVLQGTSGNGTSTATALEVKVGNNGALTALTVSNNGQLTIQGDATTDLPTYGSELLSSAGWTVNTGWTESPDDVFAHSSGTDVLTHSATITNGYKYQISWTITGRTAGSITIAVGGQSNASATATGTWGPTATSTAAFTITPTTDFNGTLSLVSLKRITAGSTPERVVKNSSGAVICEERFVGSNVSLGTNAGYSITTGSGNNCFGPNAGYSITTGSGNNCLGHQAGYSITTGSGNNCLGHQAGYSITTGGYNNCLGHQAGYSITTGSVNNCLGQYAGRSITTGGYNNCFGPNAGYSITTAIYNNCFGTNAGYAITTGGSNNCFGSHAGYSITTGSSNNCFGLHAGYSITTGSSNNCFGLNAGRYHADGSTALTDPEYSIYIGYNARGLDNSDNNSVVIGGNTPIGLGANTTVIGTSATTLTRLFGNLGLGVDSPNAAIHALKTTEQLRLGYDATNYASFTVGSTGGCTLNVNGTLNVLTIGSSGQMTLQGDATTDLPVYGSELLTSAGWTVNTGWTESPDDVFAHSSGTETLTHSATITNGWIYQISWTITGRTAGSITIAVGGQSLETQTATGTWGPIATSAAAFTITPTTDFNGTVSLVSLKRITDVSTPNRVVKNSAGTAIIEERGNSTSTFIGVGAGRYNTTGNSNSCVGRESGYSITTGSSNSCMGYNAGYRITTGSNNSCMGSNAGYSITTGSYNSCMGLNAGYSITTGITNSCMGYIAGYSITTGSSNSCMGYNAGFSITTGSYNSCMGSNAGRSITTGSSNSCMGLNSGYSITTGNYNSCMGPDAGRSITTGSYNSCMGLYAGRYHADGATVLTDPENSVYIGAHARGKDNSDNNSVVIGGNTPIGLGANTTVIGTSATTLTRLFGNLGLGVDSPNAAIHAIKTTEQLRLGYDATNYVSATVSSTGNLTLDTTGGTIYTPDVIENTTSGAGIVLRSSNGTRYMITVTDAGTLSVSAA